MTVITNDDRNETFRNVGIATNLENLVLDHEGRVEKENRPNGNAFRSLRLWRDGKSHGTLFNVRLEYYATLTKSEGDGDGESKSSGKGKLKTESKRRSPATSCRLEAVTTQKRRKQ
jgi:hypothetical protein